MLGAPNGCLSFPRRVSDRVYISFDVVRNARRIGVEPVESRCKSAGTPDFPPAVLGPWPGAHPHQPV